MSRPGAQCCMQHASYLNCFDSMGPGKTQTCVLVRSLRRCLFQLKASSSNDGPNLMTERTAQSCAKTHASPSTHALYHGLWIGLPFLPYVVRSSNLQMARGTTPFLHSPRKSLVAIPLKCALALAQWLEGRLPLQPA
eukprot:2153241-Amphidinium_carterae.2